MTIDDPITLLKAHQRTALDRQAELATEARALAARVEAVTTELATLARIVNAYNAILNLMRAATTPRPTTGTTEATEGKPAARRQTP